MRTAWVGPAVLPPVKLAIRPSHTPFHPTQSVALLAPGPAAEVTQ